MRGCNCWRRYRCRECTFCCRVLFLFLLTALRMRRCCCAAQTLLLFLILFLFLFLFLCFCFPFALFVVKCAHSRWKIYWVLSSAFSRVECVYLQWVCPYKIKFAIKLFDLRVLLYMYAYVNSVCVCVSNRWFSFKYWWKIIKRETSTAKSVKRTHNCQRAD